jgi:hypothetical protein
LIEQRRAWRDAREGAYLLRTNLKEERPDGTLDEIRSTHGSRSRFPCVEKRTGDPPDISSKGTAREGAHPGRLPRLCVMGDVQTSLETQTRGSFTSKEPAAFHGDYQNHVSA